MYSAEQRQQVSKSRVLAGLVIVGALVVSALLFRWLTRPHMPTLQETKSVLLQSSTLTVSENSPLVIVPGGVPAGLRFLVREAFGTPTVKQGTTREGKKVYTIDFSDQSALLVSYNKLGGFIRRAPGWAVSRGARANLFAVIEAKSAAYEIRVNLTAVRENLTNALVEAIER